MVPRSSFSYRSGDHRDLHSFPTRRSSDLNGFVAFQIHEVRLPEPPAVSDVRVRFVVSPELLSQLKAGDADSSPQAVGQDRKSTRLNSSHSSISYAVFCLKKKRPRLCYMIS